MPSIAVLLRGAGLVLLSVCLGWMLFAVTLHEDESDMLRVGGVSPVIHKGKRPFRSPAPVIKPAGKPSFMDWIGDEYNLRLCQCRKDWRTQPEGSSICRCRGNCPAFVTPQFLTEAKGQALCSLEEPTGYNCYAECENEKSDVKWFALPCGLDKQETCDKPILLGRKASAVADPKKAAPPPKKDDAGAAAAAAAAAEKKKKEEEEDKKNKKKKEEDDAAAAAAAKAAPAVNKWARLGYDPTTVVDLRGLQCEMLDGVERCFLEDEQGRELCPPSVTSKWLSNPVDQYLCSNDMADQYYCTAGCQEGNDEVRWGAHEIAWCDDPRNKGSCPARPKVVPKADFKLKPWSAAKEPESECARRWRLGERPKERIKRVTFGLLTHEPRSFKDSMDTYDRLGLFDVVSEFLIYINKRRPEVDAVAEEFRAKYPTIVKVLGDKENHGIARAMSYLTGNASNPYFFFLERDFQLIEPATCVVEQVEAGRELVEQRTAHVVRYRHRRHPGRPNWAARMYKGHEDDVFKSGQPNLFCNHFYWYDEPEKRWPDKMWICSKGEIPLWCSDSYYCNWTNNPQLWEVSWWKREYVDKFDSFKQSDPWYDLEMYMNWEPNSWNDRKWIVAQGAGLFKHVDRGNFGTF